MSTATLQRQRSTSGSAFFSYGFRPFFFAAATWAAIGIVLWLPQYFGLFVLPTHFDPLNWHIHEMLFGYVGAAVAGFMLTAVANWTGRPPVSGRPLAGLALLWLAGRVAILTSAAIGGVAAAVIDVSFLVVLAVVVGREIIAARNWRNLRPLALLGFLILGNVIFHAEVLYGGAADYGICTTIAAVIMLVSLIGGRIVPSFTGNWLLANKPGRLPVSFGRFDMLAMGLSGLALLAWIVAPADSFTGVLLCIAGATQLVRLVRWAGDRAVGDRLVLVLHVGYSFVPIGFLLLGASLFYTAVPASAGLHAWTAGAIGLMTLAVMTRATLGHTGRPLRAGPATQAIYGCVLFSALLRIVATLAGSPIIMLEVSAALWVAGFLLYVAAYARPLLTPKPVGTQAVC
jgi:uncharacterized protein involved in response to NO